jgi:polygalacturonase
MLSIESEEPERTAMKRPVISVCVVAIVMLLAVSVSYAANPVIATGDSRNVTQPSYPPTCQTLFAAGTTSSGPDQTSQLTSALSSCAGRGSVVLQTSGSNNGFWVKGFSMSSNQALVIDSGVTLEGSSYSGQFIAPSGSNISIMGPGTIDGRSSSGNRLINARNITNFVVNNVTLTNAGKMNLYVESGNGFTAWGITIKEKATTRNTDGVDIDSMTNATVANSFIEDGDDGIAVKTNSGAVSNVTIRNSRFRGTHGISIGSQTFHGVSNILFENNTMYGKDEWGNLSTTPAAIRVKTDPTCGGHVDKVEYLNTCITGEKQLIWLNPNYGTCSGTKGTPFYTNIVINGVFSTASASGASSMYNGFDSSHIMTLWLENISLDVTTQNSARDASIGLFNSNVHPSGTGVTTFNFSGSGSVPACAF